MSNCNVSISEYGFFYSFYYFKLLKSWPWHRIIYNQSLIYCAMQHWQISVMVRNDAGVSPGWPSLAALIVASSRGPKSARAYRGFRDWEMWRMVPALPPVGCLKRSLVMLATPVICMSSSGYPQPALSKHRQAVLARPTVMPPLFRDRWDVTSSREPGTRILYCLVLRKYPIQLYKKQSKIWTWH